MCSSIMFVNRNKLLDSLPPMKDALHYHSEHANNQALVWRQSLTPDPQLPCPTSCGWSLDSGQMTDEPKLMTLDQIPFYLQLYGIRHMVKDHSDSERGNPLPPHRPNSKNVPRTCYMFM